MLALRARSCVRACVPACLLAVHERSSNDDGASMSDSSSASKSSGVSNSSVSSGGDSISRVWLVNGAVLLLTIYLVEASSFNIESQALCTLRRRSVGAGVGFVCLRGHQAVLLLCGCLLLLPPLLAGLPAVKELLAGTPQLVAGAITVTFAIDRV